MSESEHVWERSDLQSQRDRKPFNTALDRYKVARFGWSNRLQVPANKRKIEKTNLAPGGFDQFVTTVGDSAFAFGAPLPSGAVSSTEVINLNSVFLASRAAATLSFENPIFIIQH